MVSGLLAWLFQKHFNALSLLPANSTFSCKSSSLCLSPGQKLGLILDSSIILSLKVPLVTLPWTCPQNIPVTFHTSPDFSGRKKKAGWQDEGNETSPEPRLFAVGTIERTWHRTGGVKSNAPASSLWVLGKVTLPFLGFFPHLPNGVDKVCSEDEMTPWARQRLSGWCAVASLPLVPSFPHPVDSLATELYFSIQANALPHTRVCCLECGP